MSGGRFKPLFTWRSAVCDSELGPTTKHVALTLALYMNERGGSAHPGPALLAHDTGLHLSTVKEHLRILEDTGWVIVTERGGIKGEKRRANEYEARIPNGVQESLPGAEDDPSSAPPGCSEASDPSSSPRTPGPEDDPISPVTSPGSRDDLSASDEEDDLTKPVILDPEQRRAGRERARAISESLKGGRKVEDVRVGAHGGTQK